MPRFIICHGFDSECEVIEAANLDVAKAKAAAFSMAKGLLDDDLADTTWADPFTEDRAFELGLVVLDETEAAHRAWRAAAPWR